MIKKYVTCIAKIIVTPKTCSSNKHHLNKSFCWPKNLGFTITTQGQNLGCDNKNPSLVVTRVLTTSPQEDQDQRCNLFQTRAGINGKSIKVIIYGGSCHNLASKELCDKLQFTYKKHPHPYNVQCLSDSGTFKIQHMVNDSFKIGPYEDTIACDVVPMT